MRSNQIATVAVLVWIFFQSQSVSAVTVQENVTDAVVKVFVHASQPNFFEPWQHVGVKQLSGSGCIIEGNRILTNAHVTSDHAFIEVKKSNDPKRYPAKVLALAHDSDLAILTVEDTTFFEGVTPLTLGDLPRLQDTVTVIGFPVGGDQLSITEGVVSRIDVRVYAHSKRKLLAVQIDAAINPGNSGGPVVKDGLLIGIAFQGLIEGENIGYIIPTPVISHFLEDLRDGAYDGFPQLGIHYNPIENKALKVHLKLNPETEGVLITHVDPISSAAGYLRDGDVITHLDGVPVAGDGTVAFRNQERVSFAYVLARRHMGENIPIKIVRQGEDLEIEVPLQPYNKVVPYPYTYDEPSYYIYGGIVFSVLSHDLLDAWPSQDYLPNTYMVLNYYTLGPGRGRLKERENIPLLLKVLPDDVNTGYHELQFDVVETVNGAQVKSFKELVIALETAEGPSVDIRTERFFRLVLNREAAKTANESILKKYRIPSAYSADVQEWLT